MQIVLFLCNKGFRALLLFMLPHCLTVMTSWDTNRTLINVISNTCSSCNDRSKWLLFFGLPCLPLCLASFTLGTTRPFSHLVKQTEQRSANSLRNLLTGQHREFTLCANLHQNVINIQISIFESFKIASLTLWNTITQAESVCSTGSSSSKYGSDAAVGLQASHPVKSHKLIRSAESSCCKLLVDTCHGKRSMLDQGRMSP